MDAKIDAIKKERLEKEAKIAAIGLAKAEEIQRQKELEAEQKELALV